MKETTKKKLVELKNRLKKNAPQIATAIVAVVASGAALYYRNELTKLQTVDPDAWPTISVSPRAMEDIRNGKTLLYRETSYGDRFYGQMTTMGDFSDRASEEFEAFKKTGEFRDDIRVVHED